MAGRGLRGVGTDLSCLKRTRSRLSLGSSVGGPLTDHKIYECGVGGSGPGCRRTCDSGECFGRSCLFRCSEEPTGSPHHEPRSGKWFILYVRLQTSPLAGCDDALPHRTPGCSAFAWRGYGCFEELSSPTKSLPGYATEMFWPQCGHGIYMPTSVGCRGRYKSIRRHLTGYRLCHKRYIVRPMTKFTTTC